MANITSKKHKKSTPTLEQNSIGLAQEIFFVLWIAIGVFLFVACFFTPKTGPIGHYLVTVIGQFLLGKTVVIIPFFVFAIAFSSLVPKDRLRRRVAFPALVASLITFVILADLRLHGPQYSWLWPVPLDGGGFIGRSGAFLLLNSVGLYGTLIVVSCVFLLSVILVFNISFYKTIQHLIHLFTWLGEDATPRRQTASSFFRQLANMLFYKTKNVSEAAVVEKPKRKPRKKQILPDILSPKPRDDFEPLSLAPTKDEHTAEAEKITPKIQQAPLVLDASEAFILPNVSLLTKDVGISQSQKDREHAEHDRTALLESALRSFHIDAQVVNITPGPALTRFELKPGPGVKISKITSLSMDLALKLSSPDIRIAPIAGKGLIGIEVPNTSTDVVHLRRLIDHDHFYNATSKLLSCLGVTMTGEPVHMDISKMPHLLIAGATGSGKSVLVNVIIMSILFRASPKEVKFLMIDPKKVELSLYEGIPHLLAPVVTDPNKAAATLKKWALVEMERRYDEFAKVGAKNIESYNQRIDDIEALNITNQDEAKKRLDAFLHPDGKEAEEFFVPPKLPYIMVIIDELADLMMVASQEVETTICRLAQMARATGIHLVVATQRPSVNVVTGLIKANIPSRISFFLQSQIDSRTIIDMPGAEKLLGKGDMLYSPVGSFQPKRIQGVYVSEKEIEAVVRFLKTQATPEYLDEIMDVELIDNTTSEETQGKDDMFEEAKKIVTETKYASTSYLQRKLRIGYNRAARIMDELEEAGIVSGYDGDNKTRTVI